MVELYLHSPIPLHGVMLHQLSTGTTLPFFFTFLFSCSFYVPVTIPLFDLRIVTFNMCAYRRGLDW
jgi:hypothetical protein